MTQAVHLLVDIGNSQIKWCRAASGNDQLMQPAHKFPWNLSLLPNLLDNNWSSLKDSVTQVSVANVAGEQAGNIIDQWCLDHWKITARFAKTTAQFADIKNGYDNYQNLGIDRWLAVIASHQLYPASANIIIDCGSAITVDAVLPSGEHLPGPIMLGRQGAIDSLLSKTDLSKYLNTEPGLDLQQTRLESIVKDTQSAIINGANFATSKALEAIVADIEVKLPQSSNINIIATGGAAQSVMSLSTLSTRQSTKKMYIHEPDLVLKGLACFFENQSENQ